MNYPALSDAYLGVLEHVWTKTQYWTSPRGFAIRERCDYRFDVENPTSDPIVTLDSFRNKTIAEYTKKELELYASGSTNGEDYVNLAKFWKGLLNPDGSVNSAYGHLALFDRSCGNPTFEYWKEYSGEPDESASPDWAMRTPFDWARMSLEKDKHSRQAIMQFAKRSHFWCGNNDQVCTMHISFRIREGRRPVDGNATHGDELQCSVVMRSNDLVKGTVYDCPFFIFLQEKLFKSLRDGPYPNLRMGTYTHYAHSLHIYDRDADLVKRMLGPASR